MRMKRKFMAFLAVLCMLVSNLGMLTVSAETTKTVQFYVADASGNAVKDVTIAGKIVDTADPDATIGEIGTSADGMLSYAYDASVFTSDTICVQLSLTIPESYKTEEGFDGTKTYSKAEIESWADGAQISVTTVSSTTEPETKPETEPEKEAEETYDCTGKYVNIALVVDTTGSMSSDISTVRENLTAFVKEIAASGAIPRISLIEYKDVQCDGKDSTVVHRTNDYSVWYENTEDIVAEIETLEVDGGGDIPESLIDALGYVVNEEVMTFNTYAAKFAIVLTDAGYNDANQWGIQNMDDMINRLNEKSIQTTVVTHKDWETYTWDDETGDYLRDTPSILLSDEYADLTSKTGGTIIDMSSDFSVALSEYAKKIIAATASKEIDSSYVPVTGIKLGEAETDLATEGIYKFPVTITPENATVKDVIWNVEDETIATINRDLTNSAYCVVNAKKEGSTKLIATTADGGYTAYFTLTISDVVYDGTVAVTCKADKVVSVLESAETTKVTLVSDEAAETKIETTLLKEIFETLKATGKEIAFAFENEKGEELYSWTFTGGTITDASVAVSDFKIESGKSVPAVDSAVAAIGVSTSYTDIHFVHDGSLPGKATITTTCNLSDGTVYLYYYNPTTGGLELVSSDVVVKDGKATFAIEHCSDYVLSSKKLVAESATTTTNAATTTTSPKTADDFNVAPMIGLVLMISCVGIAAFGRKVIRK